MKISFYDSLAFIILSIIIIIIFITTYFFTYGKTLEKKITDKQIKFVIKELFEEYKIILPEFTDFFKNVINSITLDEQKLKENDKKAIAENSKLVKETLLIIFPIILICIITLIYLINNHNIQTNKLIISSLITFFSVSIIYFIYTNYFIGEYLSIDPSFVMETILETLKKNL